VVIIDININSKKLCVNLVISWEHTGVHGQQNIKFWKEMVWPNLKRYNGFGRNKQNDENVQS